MYIADVVTEQIQQSVAAVCVILFIATVALFIIYQNQLEESARRV